MAMSSTPRRSLKSLFSKKEVSHDDSVEKSVDKNEGQKKRFQFLKFKSKPKTDPGPVKAVHGSQQLLSAAEPSNSAEDGGTWVDNIASDNKKLSLYGTSPRSKASILPSSSQAKALSYSELDLRKPKRIASFSFGFRRKKKNDNEENISKSTTVLDSPGLEEPKEVTPFPKIQPPLRLSQVKLDETDTKMTFSMSQPVLDTSDKFDIPSPPPVATNQSESYFTISKQSESNVDINIHPEAKEPLTNGSNLSAVREELQKAPIATIPELQLDNLESLEENENIPVYDNSNPSEPTTLTEMTFAVNDQSEPILSDSQPLIVPDTSNDKVAVAESVSLSNGPCDNDILQQSHKTTEISLTETSRDALSYHQPDAPDTADSTAQNVELSLASVDSKIDATIMESTPVLHADNSTLSADSASVHQEVSISRTEGSTPETATTVTATSTVREEKSTQPVSQTAIYGELYDSLLPQSLILEVVSSISNPPSQIRTETRHLSTSSEPILVKTLNEHHTETNVIYSHLSTSRELYSSPGKMSNATGGYTNNNATFSESKVIPDTSRFMSNETSTAFQPQRNTDIYSRYLTSPLNSAYKPADSGNIPHSTLTRSLSEVKSDSVSLIQDNVSSVSVVQSPAPPASDDVMSQEADAQVTDSKRRAILVKELVTEEVSSDPVCPSPAPEKMSTTEGLEIKIEKRQSFSAHSGLASGSDRALSPAYLSMGSDDGSATEIYYSAEEDNAEEYTVDERKESHVVDVVKEAGLREQIPQKEEIAESRIKNREEGEFRVVIVKTQSEEDIIGKEQEKVDLNSRFEVQQQVRYQRSEDKVPQIITSRFLVGSDAKSQEKEEAATVSPQVKEDRKEETKEKLPATLDNTEKSKDVEVYKVDERKESSVADVVKEAGLREGIPQKEEIAESGIRKTEEGEFRVVTAKTQSEEVKLGNKEEKLDLNSRTEVQQQARGQRSEDKVPQIITSRFLVSSDTKSQEKEEAATVLPQVKEDKKEETKEKLPTTLDNTEKSKDVEVYKVDGRKESRVADVVKEAGLREEIPQKEDIAESGIRKTEEGEFKVVIAKTQSEEGKLGKEEEKLDLNSRTEVQQQVRGQRSEDKVPRIITSRFLVGSDTRSQEKEVAATVLPQVKEDKKEERKQNVPATLDNTEKSKDVEVYKVDGRKESRVADVVKEAGLREEIPQKEDIAESGIKKTEEGEFKVVTAKTQSEEVKLGNKEEKLDLNSRTEVQQQVRGQRSEDKVPRIITSRFLVSSDAWSQEKEVAATVLPQVKGEREEEKKEELPATPVQQVNTLMVCDFAPPSSKPHGQGEGSEGNWTAELETEDPPNGGKQLPSQKTQYLSHKDTVISEYMHAVSSHTRKEDTITPRLREAEEQVSLTAQADKIGEESKDSTGTGSVTTASAVTDTSAGVKVVTGTLTHSTELQSDATETEHNRAPQSSEWVDAITQSTDRTRTVQEQVAVELSTPNVDTRRPDTKAAESLSERHQHPAEAQPDLNQGSLTASRTPTAASEVLASESQPTEADKELVDEMNSGYSSLSTKLSLKTSSPPKEDESKTRFRKVSLVNETDTTEVSEDAVDVSKTSTTVTESNGTDTSSDFKWKNRFEGVSQYRPYKTEFSSFTDSMSYRVSDTDTSPSLSSSSSALPEATAYKHLSNAYSSPSSSPAPDEHTTLGNRLSDRTTVYLRYESEPAEAPKDEWRRSLVEQEEPAAPAAQREGQRERGAESERIKSHWDSHELPVSSLSSAQQTSHDVVDSFKKEDDDDSSRFTGVFTATLVELVSEPAAPPSTPPGTPEEDSPSQFDMDSLVDTLKSMGPSLRPRNIGPRAPAPVLISSLPPIVEDAPSPITADIPGLLSPTKKMEAINNPAESLKGLYTLPADLGLKKTSNRDTRSPLELMKQSQQDLPQPGTRGLNLPQRASATNSIVMRKSSDSSPEELKSPVLNGNGLLPSSTTGSRLDSSVIFGSHRSASIDQPLENGKAHRSLFRTSSLPETGPLKDRMSMGPKELGDQSTEPAGSRFDRFSFLLNSSPSASSLTGSEDSTRISRPPLLGMGSPPSSNSPTRLLSPTGSIDLQRPFTTTDSPLSVFGQTQGLGMGMGVGAGVLSPPILQRSFSNEGIAGVQQTPLFSSLHGVSSFQSQEVETEKTLAVKYRAFPDAYLTKEKEHGKLNPRPGKMYIFDRPGMCGQRIEIRSDVIDATPWELQETISIRVVRGGWVMYEKPNFKGEKIALDEGDIELTYPFSPPEEQLQNGQEGERQNGEATDAQAETKPARRFIIGSLRRAVRDYSVPEISLFPEENAEGKKVIFRDTSEDARIFGFPVKANSIIINAGLWLVYAHPFFQGVPRVMEVGGYSNPAAWGVEQPYVGSLHPLKVGEPRVENTSEPKMVIYDKPYFSGKSRTITTNTRDFITRVDRQQTAFMYNVGSLKVLGGIWVGYEKEGFRGHQYLLEEGEYQDWRVWGGNDAELRSARVIRADLTDPVMVMFEQPEEDQEGMSEENTFEVTEAIPDVELFGYKTSTRSIHVLSGAWIAYSHVDFSGNQYILEKGFYNNCADWGSQDTRICSVQPILLAPGDNARSRTEIILYSEPDFQGDCHVFDRNQEATPEKLLTKSCRVSGGSWVVYENKQYSGNLYVLSEGDYPSLTSMGCLSDVVIRSVKVVPMKFSVPSISLFGLECLEGREITTDTEIPSMVEEGFNNHILSVRVNSGCWVICEHSNYRGRQFLLEQIEITNWPKFSSLQTIGSMFPVRQKRRYFRIKSKERGHFMSVQGGVEEMKSGRVVVAPEVEPMSDIWFYQDGFIKSKLAQNMSLQVMGNIEPGAKVVLWTETRQPIQTWAAQMSGLITSLTFPGCVLDVKGGKTYDKDHVVMMPENEERPSQQWEIELL
uniref:uncharacterized protein crybg2 isoform X1 n=1 Tax=Epinephelus lanceolatus TaxID=310571 RepID=UPI0014452A17|nr:uncharacterized protein crybg2 isoform X1 [Epinephelus lanceolatus]